MSIRIAIALAAVCLLGATQASTQENGPVSALELKPGVWTDITPPGLNLIGPGKPGFHSYGVNGIEVDPSKPTTLYAAIDQLGLWKSSDAGATWMRLGKAPGEKDPRNFGITTGYLDSPLRVKVDPKDSRHLYATQGVRGDTQGFWISTDGGATWAQPPGFVAIHQQTTRDVTTIAVDPTDFDHVLLGSHSPWAKRQNAGIMETKDGGKTFLVHDPVPEMHSGTAGVHFLFAPALKLGDAKTWLFADDGAFWRTADAGATWTKVFPTGATHGGNQIYYTKAGMLYAGAALHPLRSGDNGATWEQLKKLPYSYYYTVHGDGKTLYTALAFTGDNGGQGGKPIMISPESDGLTWSPYQGGTQTFTNGPYEMVFDAVNRIMYSANWDAGVWALKVPAP